MVDFKPIRIKDSQLATYEIKEGQLIYTTDKVGTYIDISDTTRIKITDINTITETERSDMLAPITGFHYTTDKHQFWYYDGSEWHSLNGSSSSSSPLIIEITKAEYEELVASGQVNPEAYYYITDDFDASTIIDDNTPSSDHVYSGEKVENTFSKKSDVVDTTMLAANWTGSTAPYNIVLTVNGVTANNINELNYSKDCTEEQIKAYQECGLADGGQATNQITILATKKKPTVDIPVTIIVRHDN